MIHYGKLSIIAITILFAIILLVTAMVSIASGEWKNLSLTLLASVCLIIPFIIRHFANLKNLVLPARFELTTIILIFMAQYLGEIKNFYLMFWWWDLLLHAIFGSYAVIIGRYLIGGIFNKKEEISEQRFEFFKIAVAFSVSITLGAFWEMFEFVGDYLFKATMVKGGLEDTATDLLITILAAFITSLRYYYRPKPAVL